MIVILHVVKFRVCHFTILDATNIYLYDIGHWSVLSDDDVEEVNSVTRCDRLDMFDH